MTYRPPKPRSPINFRFSKSSFLNYDSCPYKFKLHYIKAIKQEKTGFEIYANIGNSVHKQIENFYKQDVKIEEVEVISKITKKKKKIKQVKFNKIKHKKSSHMKNFIKFQETILTEIDTVGKDLGYFKPIAQEVDYSNYDLNIHGIIDAVYINYEDDGVVIVDWKSGKVKSLKVMRAELAFYAHCWNGNKQLVKKYGEVKYWCMYYTKSNYQFIERVQEDIMRDIRERIVESRKLVEMEMFPKTMDKTSCSWCGYRDQCQKEDKK